MLFALYPTLTQNYFVLCFFVCLGTLQWAAARNQNLGISLTGSWGLTGAGRVGGILTVMIAFGWFCIATPEMYAPGLAGGELSTIFGLGGLSALLITRLASKLWQKLDRL